MAYNYGFPINYQSFYPQSQPSNFQQNNSDLKWVQGESAAKSYIVAPNNTIALWDSESQTIYLKSADTIGMPSMKILDYTIRNESTQSVLNNQTQEVSRKDLDILQGQIDALREEINKQKGETTL